MCRGVAVRCSVIHHITDRAIACHIARGCKGHRLISGLPLRLGRSRACLREREHAGIGIIARRNIAEGARIIIGESENVACLLIGRNGDRA